MSEEKNMMPEGSKPQVPGDRQKDPSKEVHGSKPTTSKQKPATENMETHAHHLHKAPGKKWTHYIFEFLMLFLAVFAGFLAENWREHFVEREKETQYMKSLVSDLENDTANLNAGFPLKEERLKAIDSVFIFFKANPDAKWIPGSVYRYM